MEGENMRFIVFGDSKGKNHGINEKVLKKILHISCKLNPKPEFIVVCGDSIAGSTNEKILRYQLNNFKSILNKYHPNKTILPVIGNHEVNITPHDDKFELIFFNDIINDATGSTDNYSVD